MAIPLTQLLIPFREILDQICSGTPLPNVFQSILTEACVLAKAHHGSLVYVDYPTRSLPILCAAGPDWTDEKISTRLKIGQGVTGVVAESGKPYLCHNTEQYSIYVELFPNIKSEMAVPVIIHEKVWAVINIDSDRYEAFDADAVSTLKLFADLIALAMQLTEPDVPQSARPSSLPAFAPVHINRPAIGHVEKSKSAD